MTNEDMVGIDDARCAQNDVSKLMSQTIVAKDQLLPS